MGVWRAPFSLERRRLNDGRFIVLRQLGISGFCHYRQQLTQRSLLITRDLKINKKGCTYCLPEMQ